MREFMGESDELNSSGMVLVDTELIMTPLLRSIRLPLCNDRAGLVIPSVDENSINPLSLESLWKQSDARGVELAFGKKRGHHTLRQILALGVQDVVDKHDWPERPQNKKGTRARFGTAIEFFVPIVCGSRIAEAGLLNLQKHGIERREVTKLHNKVQQLYIITRTGIESGLSQK